MINCANKSWHPSHMNIRAADNEIISSRAFAFAPERLFEALLAKD